LHVPAGYDASHPLPLLLVFHGYYGSAGGMESVTGLSAIADQKGFAIAYGSGVSQSWNAGKCCGSSASSDRPDVQYVSDVIDHVSTELCIDPKRVYATGMSNGGMLSNRLGCELAHRLAAIAPVAGPRAIDACQPSRPLPVIAFHGTEDWIVPYDGGGSGGAEPVKASFDFWSKNAGCTDAEPAVVHQNGSVTCIQNAACAAGARVQLCTVQGGGHQWPGGVAIPGLGDQTNDISASAALVDFVLSHALP
jgi:polyhydroxybutyrate depolymerase